MQNHFFNCVFLLVWFCQNQPKKALLKVLINGRRQRIVRGLFQSTGNSIEKLILLRSTRLRRNHHFWSVSGHQKQSAKKKKKKNAECVYPAPQFNSAPPKRHFQWNTWTFGYHPTAFCTGKKKVHFFLCHQKWEPLKVKLMSQILGGVLCRGLNKKRILHFNILLLQTRSLLAWSSSSHLPLCILFPLKKSHSGIRWWWGKKKSPFILVSNSVIFPW